jgi:hypothetical protein
VRKQLSLPGFPDEPELFDSIETWQQFLAEVEAMPDSVQKAQTNPARRTYDRAQKGRTSPNAEQLGVHGGNDR